MSQYQKGTTNLDLLEQEIVSGSCIMGHMQICTLPQTINHASIPPLSFLQARCPSCCPTNNIKALKALVFKLKSNAYNTYVLFIHMKVTKDGKILCMYCTHSLCFLKFQNIYIYKTDNNYKTVNNEYRVLYHYCRNINSVSNKCYFVKVKQESCAIARCPCDAQSENTHMVCC